MGICWIQDLCHADHLIFLRSIRPLAHYCSCLVVLLKDSSRKTGTLASHYLSMEQHEWQVSGGKLICTVIVLYVYNMYCYCMTETFPHSCRLWKLQGGYYVIWMLMTELTGAFDLPYSIPVWCDWWGFSRPRPRSTCRVPRRRPTCQMLHPPRDTCLKTATAEICLFPAFK